MDNITSLKKAIIPVAEKHGLSLVVLFGSQASGHTHTGSDTDIAVIASHSLRPAEVALIAFDLSTALHVHTVDVSLLNGATPLLLKQVAQKGIVLYERTPALFSNFRIYALKRFMETRPLRIAREKRLNDFLHTV